MDIMKHQQVYQAQKHLQTVLHKMKHGTNPRVTECKHLATKSRDSSSSAAAHFQGPCRSRPRPNKDRPTAVTQAGQHRESRLWWQTGGPVMIVNACKVGFQASCRHSNRELLLNISSCSLRFPKVHAFNGLGHQIFVDDGSDPSAELEQLEAPCRLLIAREVRKSRAEASPTFGPSRQTKTT